jgi:restriction system protein
MALWLVRGGKYGEFEDHFLEHDRVCLTWGGLEETDLSPAQDFEGVKAILQRTYPNESPRKLGNWTGQIWAFAFGIKTGDWVILPRKRQATIAIGEMAGPYRYERSADPLFRHGRKVIWLNREVPRSVFEQDLLYSFGAFMTICEIKRNDAERRVRAIAEAGWRSAGPGVTAPAAINAGGNDEPTEDVEMPDLEQLAGDQIAQRIEREFKGHGLARLVAAILNAQGYATHVSLPGPDKGVDILAAPDPLGFGSPRICVQVKSGDEPVDRPTMDQLIGVMQNVGAEQGLLVSWGGFKTSVERETASQFFRVRLWGKNELVEQILQHYERLPAELRAELPLKRIWAVAAQEE